jgi:hypothetical protein
MMDAQEQHDRGICPSNCDYCYDDNGRELLGVLLSVNPQPDDPDPASFHARDGRDLSLATCGGCGAYGTHGRTCVRFGQECGQFA